MSLDIEYVETADGSECYEVVEAPFVNGSLNYTVYAGGVAIATYDWQQSTNITTATCSDGTSMVINTAAPCGAWPWLNQAPGGGCDQGGCSFGALPVAPVGNSPTASPASPQDPQDGVRARHITFVAGV